MVTKFLPLPDNNGGHQRSLAIARRLAGLGDRLVRRLGDFIWIGEPLHLEVDPVLGRQVIEHFLNGRAFRLEVFDQPLKGLLVRLGHGRQGV